jgi:CBS domain-containing protein
MVRDYMATELTVVAPEQDVLRAMRLLLERGVSGAPVIDAQGNLVGLLTQRDCMTVAFQTAYHGDAAGSVAEYMTREVETVPVQTTLVEVVERFYRSPHRRFPVMDGNQLVGQISRRDVLRAVLALA